MKIQNKDKIILDLCDGTGAWSKPYEEAGYDVRVITLPEHDVRTYVPPKKVYGILAAPPCTEFSILKNHNIPRDFDEGMEIVNACLRIMFLCSSDIPANSTTFHALENPVGLLKRFLGKEKYIFQPWWYGDPWTKRTALWGEFKKPFKKYYCWSEVPKNNKLYIRPRRSKPSIAFMHKSSSKDCFPYLDKDCESDAEFRAITPQGFARAFFEVNQ